MADTQQIKLKCVNCGLHYVVLSWPEVHEEWVEKFQGGYCPECGIKGNKIAWQEPLEGQIFEVVPGRSEMVGMFGLVDVAAFGHGAMAAKSDRGPYGTNPGDTWVAPGSDIQQRLDADGQGYVLIHYVNEEGEDTVFTTDDETTIEQAIRGHERWVAAQAERN